MHLVRLRFFVLLAGLLSVRHVWAADTVRVSEESITIPTYLIGPADPNPQFYSGGASQGAEHRIYPYPLYDNLTTEKKDKSYQIVYLENEYIRVGILPEIGGKIFEAIDKTNGYNFFYRQHVIKPALISLLGAWISGGVEWDVPHHHRATSFLPVQYSTESASDGSKTVWVGELELRDRMRWAVGITLHPGKSYLEASFRMINRTPVPTSMLCFSNVAVSVNDDYQVIFPPSTQYVTYHAKVEFATWPIGSGRFRGTDFTGVDESWYKNHFNSNSMFAWNYTDDFFAGYDHGKHAGTMSIADHNVVPGKKFWTWGNGPRGRMQDTLLTDSDGPYIELMVGAYSDNQPDYTWLAPYESRQWTQYWYPFRDINGVKNANTEAAVNLDVKDGQVRVGFYSTSPHAQATARLTLKDQVLFSEEVAINPGKSFVKQIKLPAGADEHDLKASLLVNGKELVSYSPVKLTAQPAPTPYVPPEAPEQIKTNEELYLAGLRIDAFHNPQMEPEPYWEEALKRDPNDVRVNTVLAINQIKRAQYADAEKHLRAAVERAGGNYTTPKDGEPFYYLGLALRGQGKVDEADVQFQKATWSGAWRSAAYFESAQIASLRGNYDDALTLADRSLLADGANIRAITLRSAMMRHLGRPNDALGNTAYRLVDPLDARAAAERYFVSRDGGASLETLKDIFATAPNAQLETAIEYMNAGLWEDATKVLKIGIEPQAGKAKVSPLVYYDLAYCAQKLNDARMAGEWFAAGAKASSDYVFPFQREQIDVLEAAMAANPADAHASYYLGNLLFDWQPQRAVELWEKSVAGGADFPVVYHNLATAYTRANQRDKALAMLEKAAGLGGNAMIFRDLDQLYEENGVAPLKRLALMESHQPVIDRDDVIAREINLKIVAGKADDALKLLQSRFFHVWEGSGQYAVGDSWTNALLSRGQEKIQKQQFAEALADFQMALKLPSNLTEATLPQAREPEIQYWIGVAYGGMKQPDSAKAAWQKSVDFAAPAPDARGRGGRGARGAGSLAAGTRVVDAVPFYQAGSLERLGQTDRAKAIYQQLIDAGKHQLESADAQGKSRVADAHYLIGLGEAGLNHLDVARAEFQQAIQLSADHLGATQMMGMLK